MKNKYIKEYDNKYGDIPNDFTERFLYLINILNIKKCQINKLKYEILKSSSIKYKEFSFIFYFTPQATPRPRYSKFTKSFYIKNKLDYNKIFKEFMEVVDMDIFPIITPCEFYCTSYFPIPSSMNKVEKIMAELGFIHHIGKPDFDNVAKTYADMIQKHLIYDDALIYKGIIEKRYSIKPRVEITIRYMETFDSKYNRKKADKHENV